MSQTLNAALVGYGFAGKTFHAPFLTSTPGLSLGWVVSRDAAKVQADLPGCRVGSLEEVLADSAVDLVVIATPNDTHAPIARQALLAGKHVVIDKPFALDLAEAKALVELAGKQQRLLSIFHNRRWDGDFLTVRRLLAEGALGQIAQFESHFDRYRPEVRQRWREAGGPGSGLWFDLGPHILDQALQLFGQPDWLQADLALQRPGALSDDYFHVTLGYGELRVILHGSCLVSATMPRFVIHGSEGSFIKFGMDVQEDQLKLGKRPPAADWGLDDEPGQLSRIREGQLQQETVAGEAGDYGAYYRGVCAAILGEGENPVPASEALAVMALLELARDSHQQGKRLVCQNLSD
ncbi:oxidoreductase [Aeromonas salmonicida]|uniref:oxidoreductase n=1 Tax=Aeromonas salmonicida TaxID=645 RepID=UPI000F7B95B3|nr:oxidoreductase [Aeromonas salmonicida]RSM25304.1 oxidoreductase [Aeromonas salmonicida]